MRERQLTWNVEGRGETFAREWRSEKPKALICLVHGHAEHIGRYEHVAKYFVDRDIAVIANDLPGHGKSYGKRGHISDYEHFMDDTAALLAEGRKNFPGIPIFLYGHSMGGNIVLNFALQRQPDIAGYILTSPWIKLYEGASAAQQIMAKVMRKIYPGLTQKTKLDASRLTHDAEIVRKYVTDPLVHGLMSIELYLSIEEAAEWALSSVKEKLNRPMYVLHGSADKITDVKGSTQLANKAGFLVNHKVLSDSFHELHNEPNYAEVLSLIFNWILTIRDE